MSNVIPFPGKSDIEPRDDEVMLMLTIDGKGKIDLSLNSYCETTEQFNWLLAKLVEAGARIVDLKCASV